MRTEEVIELVRRVAAIDSSSADCVVLKGCVADLRVLQSWIEGRQVGCVRRLATESSFPEKSFAEAANTSLHHGGKLLERAATAGSMPVFGSSLDEGRVSGEHVDVLTRTLRGLEPAARDKLIRQAERLVVIAENATPDEFGRSVRAEARRLESGVDLIAWTPDSGG